jgi:hypothetical protein
MHSPLAEGNLCNKSGNALKMAIAGDYNRHTGYVDKSDRDDLLLYQQMVQEMDKKASLPPSRFYCSQKFYHSRLL